jgi:DNA-binding IclR family transcriptional regulator
VLDAHGRAIAAVGVALPADRLDEDRKTRILGALRSAAAGIARDVEDASR